ncbi:LLM class flavin-dependent oxidoreductase [Bacillus sp. ISL-47]|uniref:LLM class flavin-dependent oxidoreductase n=1 Tax=Bacillus sp. ISL-47 TaxID=2819130 RepID=UPI001BE9D0DD|nr:LLM class flavin-dependent oxidoreductase [Bacillus sp. ISL-47]MBT2687480.1 LLM class flavin-dependent oxidoreductase [Bacillus sp. ISL-47]MBT2711171.1 LLM class flavin-dependent oxidoreductase [Pseudomonas sp. ISL-84]
MKLSVLDQSVITKGESAGDALRKTVKLAQTAEELGYTRFWVAEHHNSNGIAGSSPEVLISHIASSTRHIRVGSGGVLLPQYSPYKIAENFNMLETLFPGRIDLGVGRSPGGSASTRLALTDGVRKSLNEFPRQVKDLQFFLYKKLPEGHPYQTVEAIPQVADPAQIWMLGITHRGARLAAEYGTAFTYGHFITPANGKRAMDTYMSQFRPSAGLSKPKANVCIFVVCAETQERAEELALSQDMWLLAVEKGRDTRIIAPSEAKSITLTPEEKAKAAENRKRMIIGTPAKVKEELQLLSEIYQTNEFMVITNIYDFQDKLNSYRLLSEAFA